MPFFVYFAFATITAYTNMVGLVKKRTRRTITYIQKRSNFFFQSQHTLSLVFIKFSWLPIFLLTHCQTSLHDVAHPVHPYRNSNGLIAPFPHPRTQVPRFQIPDPRSQNLGQLGDRKATNFFPQLSFSLGVLTCQVERARFID